MREFHHLHSCFTEKALLSFKVKEGSACKAFETVSKYSTFLQQVDEMGKSMDLHFAPPPSEHQHRQRPKSRLRCFLRCPIALAKS